MYIFKTSGSTFDSVIRNQMHAFVNEPRDWLNGELILVSKNRVDCSYNEKQIQYTMRLVTIRPLKVGEVGQYWPGNEGRWRYLVICNDTKRINQPFNLHDLMNEENCIPYRSTQTFRKFESEHEKIINDYLEKVGAF